ncbi:PLP-dependent aminotransferase family protein, partial [Bacillus cereus group sp. Bce025]
LFIELVEKIHARTRLQKCYEQGVTFSPGDVFHSVGEGATTFRLGFSRLKEEEIVRAIKIIGDTIKNEIWS